MVNLFYIHRKFIFFHARVEAFIVKKFILSFLLLLLCIVSVNAEWVDTTSDAEFKYYIERSSVRYVNTHNPPYYLAKVKLESLKENYYIETNIYVYETDAFEVSKGDVYNKLNGRKIDEVEGLSVRPIQGGSIIYNISSKIIQIENNEQQYIKNENLKKAQEAEKKRKQDKIFGKVVGSFVIGIVASIVSFIYYKFKARKKS